MRKIILFISFIILESVVAKIEMAISYFRHGARRPLHKILKEQSSENLGELTQFGERQLYVIGQILRKRYVEDQKLLSEQYKSNEIYARATSTKRTIASALCLLYGLYPLNTRNKFESSTNPSENWRGEENISNKPT